MIGVHQVVVADSLTQYHWNCSATPHTQHEAHACEMQSHGNWTACSSHWSLSPSGHHHPGKHCTPSQRALLGFSQLPIRVALLFAPHTSVATPSLLKSIQGEWLRLIADHSFPSTFTSMSAGSESCLVESSLFPLPPSTSSARQPSQIRPSHWRPHAALFQRGMLSASYCSEDLQWNRRLILLISYLSFYCTILAMIFGIVFMLPIE